MAWIRERRVILVRESPSRAPVETDGKARRGKDRQGLLPNATGTGWETQGPHRRNGTSPRISHL